MNRCFVYSLLFTSIISLLSSISLFGCNESPAKDGEEVSEKKEDTLPPQWGDDPSILLIEVNESKVKFSWSSAEAF